MLLQETDNFSEEPSVVPEKLQKKKMFMMQREKTMQVQMHNTQADKERQQLQELLQKQKILERENQRLAAIEEQKRQEEERRRKEEEEARLEQERKQQEERELAERMQQQLDEKLRLEQERLIMEEQQRLAAEVEATRLEVERMRLEAEAEAEVARLEAERKQKLVDEEVEAARLEAERIRLEAEAQAERERLEAERKRKEAEAEEQRLRDAGAQEREQVLMAKAALKMMKTKAAPPPANIEIDPEIKRQVLHSIQQGLNNKDLRSITEVLQKALDHHMSAVPEVVACQNEVNRWIAITTNVKVAIDERILPKLDTAVNTVKKEKLESLCAADLKLAENLREWLALLEKTREQIVNMKAALVAELKSYTSPPRVVHDVMASAFLILGQTEKQVSTWAQIVSLLGKTGKESFKRRLVEFDAKSVTPVIVAAVHKRFKAVDFRAVREASAGATLFYAWVEGVLEEMNQRQKLSVKK